MNTKSTQMFALKSVPPMILQAVGKKYKLKEVFKHDFWAATCLYKLTNATPEPKRNIFNQIVVKFGRNHNFSGLPIELIGQWLVGREYAVYQQLEGISGIPRLVEKLSKYSFAIEFIENAKPLDHIAAPPDGFFDKLRKIFDAIHNRGLAYIDSNKRSNILVKDNGEPVLIDFQISALKPDAIYPFNKLQQFFIKYMAGKDIYHLLKHKKRMRPDELTEQEKQQYLTPKGLHELHRKFLKPYKKLRRSFLKKQASKGFLESPTSKFESHYQPEKQTWQKMSDKTGFNAKDQKEAVNEN